VLAPKAGVDAGAEDAGVPKPVPKLKAPLAADDCPKAGVLLAPKPGVLLPPKPPPPDHTDLRTGLLIHLADSVQALDVHIATGFLPRVGGMQEDGNFGF